MLNAGQWSGDRLIRTADLFVAWGLSFRSSPQSRPRLWHAKYCLGFIDDDVDPTQDADCRPRHSAFRKPGELASFYFFWEFIFRVESRLASHFQALEELDFLCDREEFTNNMHESNKTFHDGILIDPTFIAAVQKKKMGCRTKHGVPHSGVVF